MNGKYFIDTNVFIYSFANDQPAKQERSMDLIQGGMQSGLGIISTQVIQEFFNVATRKFAIPMKPEDGKVYLRLVMNPLCQIYPDLSLYETCLDLQAETGYSFYDSLILSAAIRGECDFLYSECLHDGQDIHGVQIINPYR
jgi:predicted nucleic acid-binding protein